MSTASPFVNRFSFFLPGLRSGATFAVALGSAGLLAQFGSAPPIFIALVASLVAAGMAFFFSTQDPFDSDYSTIGQVSSHLVTFVVAMIGLSGVVNVLPATGTFVCEPLVPWKFSIALFGAFGTSWLSSALKIRVPGIPSGLVIHVIFFWIAPFYGFFHAPWFLAQTVAVPCDDRPLAQAIAVVLGMVVAAIAGRRTSTWLFG